MEIAYKVTQSFGENYCTKGSFTKVDDFVDYITEINTIRLGDHKVWVWDENSNCVSCVDEEGKIFNSLGEAISFAIEYLQKGNKYFVFYNIYDHNVTYEFINLEAECGMELYYRLFNDSVTLYYDESFNEDGTHSAVLMLNPCTALKHYNEYKDKYNKVKKFVLHNSENTISLINNKKNFHIVSNYNAKTNVNVYSVVVKDDDIEKSEDTVVFAIDAVRID